MNRKQWVAVTCEHCRSPFSVTPARAGKARFCGIGCANAAQRTSPREARPCKCCGTIFTAMLDHGKWQKFCSRTCFEAGAPTPEWKTCPTCDGKFLATRGKSDSPDGLRKFCSKKCALHKPKTGDHRTCIHCNAEFYLTKAHQRQRPDDSCCSAECAQAFYVKERAPGWKGGEYNRGETGERMRLLPRDGWVGKYVGEHRIVAMQAIGRGLMRHEYVLRINRLESDNRPENLFICTNSEFSKRRNGSMPWPAASNLGTYK